jgi:SWI/SNF-related matrix-associated actin-dependent regulator of chromatin subfamily A3
MQVEGDEQSLLHSIDHQTLLYFPPDHLTSSGYVVGKIQERSAQILQTLHEDVSIDVQIVLSQRQKSITKLQKRQFDQVLGLVSFSVVLYGPETIAEDVGQFCQDCDVYLQDPHDCNRNVVYSNPHSLSPLDGQRLMTSELHRHRGGAVITEVHRTDTLHALLAPRSLDEINTPSGLRTDLFPYAKSPLRTSAFALLTYRRHQRQALWFMMQRELGWALRETECDLWSELTNGYQTRQVT